MKTPACSCEHCQSLCSRFPGWLTPRDVRRLARHLGVSESSLFRTHLSVDGYYGFDTNTWVPLPMSARAGPGQKLTRRPGFFMLFDEGLNNSACGLQKDGLCTIHEAKPRECRFAYSSKCTTSKDQSMPHSRFARAWARPGVQEWLASLLTEAGLDAKDLMRDEQLDEDEDEEEDVA